VLRGQCPLGCLLPSIRGRTLAPFGTGATSRQKADASRNNNTMASPTVSFTFADDEQVVGQSPGGLSLNHSRPSSTTSGQLLLPSRVTISLAGDDEVHPLMATAPDGREEPGHQSSSSSSRRSSSAMSGSIGKESITSKQQAAMDAFLSAQRSPSGDPVMQDVTWKELVRAMKNESPAPKGRRPRSRAGSRSGGAWSSGKDDVLGLIRVGGGMKVGASDAVSITSGLTGSFDGSPAASPERKVTLVSSLQSATPEVQLPGAFPLPRRGIQQSIDVKDPFIPALEGETSFVSEVSAVTQDDSIASENVLNITDETYAANNSKDKDLFFDILQPFHVQKKDGNESTRSSKLPPPRNNAVVKQLVSRMSNHEVETMSFSDMKKCLKIEEFANKNTRKLGRSSNRRKKLGGSVKSLEDQVRNVVLKRDSKLGGKRNVTVGSVGSSASAQDILLELRSSTPVSGSGRDAKPPLSISVEGSTMQAASPLALAPSKRDLPRPARIGWASSEPTKENNARRYPSDDRQPRQDVSYDSPGRNSPTLLDPFEDPSSPIPFDSSFINAPKSDKWPEGRNDSCSSPHSDGVSNSLFGADKTRSTPPRLEEIRASISELKHNGVGGVGLKTSTLVRNEETGRYIIRDVDDSSFDEMISAADEKSRPSVIDEETTRDKSEDIASEGEADLSGNSLMVVSHDDVESQSPILFLLKESVADDDAVEQAVLAATDGFSTSSSTNTNGGSRSNSEVFENCHNRDDTDKFVIKRPSHDQGGFRAQWRKFQDSVSEDLKGANDHDDDMWNEGWDDSSDDLSKHSNSDDCWGDVVQHISPVSVRHKVLRVQTN